MSGLIVERENDRRIIRCLPLPRFPQGSRNYGEEMVKDEDTLVLTRLPSKALRLELGTDSKAPDGPYLVAIAVNDSQDNLRIGAPEGSSPKFQEIVDRLFILMEHLHLDGTLELGSLMVVPFILRDGIMTVHLKVKTVSRLDRSKSETRDSAIRT